MADYFHLTPEALTMRFYSKSQVKNSNLCDITDDNLPDNLFALKGDQLEIKESDNTLNKDLALALGFNQIFDQTTANQVGKLLIANGPTLDPKTILYYVRRLKNGPYGYGITQHIKANFEQAKTAGNLNVPFQQNLGGGSNIDNDFVSFLQKKLGAADCFLTPADYFDFRGVYGTLTNTQNIWNYTTASASDTNNPQQRGYEASETAGKIPKPMQIVTGVLNLATLGTYKKFLKLFKTEKELADEAASLKSGVSVREQNGGDVTTPDLSSAINRQKASTDAISEIAEFLGDAFRVFTFQYRANPYGYTNSEVSPGNNAMVPQPPGVAGPPPKMPKPVDNSNLSLPQDVPQIGAQPTTNIGPNLLLPLPPAVTVVPYSKITTTNPKINFRETSPTYQDFKAGKSQYVGVIAHTNIGTSEEALTISGFELNNSPIPLRIVGFSSDVNDATRIRVLVDPNTQPFNPVTGNLTSEQANKTAQTCTASAQANNVSSNAEISPPDRIYTSLSYTLSARIDTDGVNPPPFTDTTRRRDGGTKYFDGILDANVDNYVVIPIGYENEIPGGTRVKLTNSVTGKTINAFVGDTGPRKNGLGEMSLNAARELGVVDGINSTDPKQPITWQFEVSEPKVTATSLISLRGK